MDLDGPLLTWPIKLILLGFIQWSDADGSSYGMHSVWTSNVIKPDWKGELTDYVAGGR